MFRIIVPALCLLAGTAYAKDLKVLTGAGMSMPVRALAADFGARTGNTVTVVSDTAGGVQKRMEVGEKFDLVIGTEAVMDALTKEGKVAGQRDRLAQMVAGIGARAGSAKPAIADAEETKATLLAARISPMSIPPPAASPASFSFPRPTSWASASKCGPRRCSSLMEHGVAAAAASGRRRSMASPLVSEMLPNKGVTVWPLPDALQMTTIYAAALSSDAQNAMDAKSLLDDLRGQRGRDESLKAGLKPVK